MNIEELAFKDRRELANLNTIDLLDIIELLQKDRKQWIYQFTNTFNESLKINETALSIYKENQDLKKQLHEASLTIQEMTEQDIECPSNCEKLKKLNKQLEEEKNKYIKRFEKLLAEDIEPDPEDFYLAEIEGKSNDYDKLLNQQKEFIKWLEAMNKMYQNEYKDIDTAEHYNCVLKKYQEIIGDDK